MTATARHDDRSGAHAAGPVVRNPSPPDPLAPAPAPGRHEDDLVVVERRGAVRPRRGLGGVRTEHFDLTAGDHRLHLRHGLTPADLDDDLAGLLADELFAPGWVGGQELFERVFAGVVRSAHDDPVRGWEAFYRNTLRRLDALVAVPPPPGGSAAGHGSLAAYAPVHARVAELVTTPDVLELGCCFGFTSLRLAAAGHDVVADDVSAGTVRLLAEMAPRLGVRLRTLTADAARVPLPDGCVGTVLAVHLLEHLTAADGGAVLAEARRLARHRVVVAVPLETEPTTAFGHVRTVGLDDLAAWGDAAAGWRAEVFEHHGGWLVLTRR